MNLKPLGVNKIELSFNDENDTRVLFSYETPVAYTQLTSEGKLYFIVDKFYSNTTSRHINSWLPKALAHKTTEGNIKLLIDSFGKGE
jgi:hypothetical protein